MIRTLGLTFKDEDREIEFSGDVVGEYDNGQFSAQSLVIRGMLVHGMQRRPKWAIEFSREQMEEAGGSLGYEGFCRETLDQCREIIERNALEMIEKKRQDATYPERLTT